jgi:hypothetical protein
VQPAELLDRALDRAPGRLRAADVDFDSSGAIVPSRNFGCGQRHLQGRGVDVEERDAGASADQGECHRPAQADITARAGHDRDLPGELVVRHGSSSSSRPGIHT